VLGWDFGGSLKAFDWRWGERFWVVGGAPVVVWWRCGWYLEDWGLLVLGGYGR